MVANGGIEHWADVQRTLTQTKADGVMSSEAILENPRLFSPTHFASGVVDDLAIAKEYIEVYLWALMCCDVSM